MTSTTPSTRPWICAQIGAREHYAIPRVLARQQKLESLITDYWWPQAPLRPATAVGRYHPQLGATRVVHLNKRALIYDGLARLRTPRDWNRIQARNNWFQRVHLEMLQKQRMALQSLPPGIFFAYSYAAQSLLKFFRGLGWKTMLGQIDPGPREADLITRERANHNHYHSHWQPPPVQYWDNLLAEQELADRILVNSAWSQRLCLEAGVDERKIRILPLAFENTENLNQDSHTRQYPQQFDHNRPLRVLFLGQLTLRKGIHYLLDSIEELAGEPVEFWLVGPRDFELPVALAAHPQITWTGAVTRRQAADYYARADVFILPTLSDGFAITQLEAQAQRLPVIASRHCGEVVQDGVNGLIVDPVDSGHISACLRRCLGNPGLLARLSESSRVADKYSLDALACHLQALETD